MQKRKPKSIYNNKNKILQMKDTIPSNLYLIKHSIYQYISVGMDEHHKL